MASGQNIDTKEGEKNLPVIVRRKILSSGGSKVITIPIGWLNQYSLKEGDNVLVIANGSLKIIPDDEKIIAKLHEAVSGANIE